MTTFLEFAPGVLAHRKEDGIRGHASEVNRYSMHIETASFATMELETIKSRHVRDWLRDMSRKDAADTRGVRKLQTDTVKRAYALVSSIFTAALEQELIESNPCLGVKVKKRADESTTVDKWAFLTVPEQEAINPVPSGPRAGAREDEAGGSVVLREEGDGQRAGQHGLITGDAQPEPVTEWLTKLTRMSMGVTGEQHNAAQTLLRALGNPEWRGPRPERRSEAAQPRCGKCGLPLVCNAFCAAANGAGLATAEAPPADTLRAALQRIVFAQEDGVQCSWCDDRHLKAGEHRDDCPVTIARGALRRERANPETSGAAGGGLGPDTTERAAASTNHAPVRGPEEAGTTLCGETWETPNAVSVCDLPKGHDDYHNCDRPAYKRPPAAPNAGLAPGMLAAAHAAAHTMPNCPGGNMCGCVAYEARKTWLVCTAHIEEHHLRCPHESMCNGGPGCTKHKSAADSSCAAMHIDVERYEALMVVLAHARRVVEACVPAVSAELEGSTWKHSRISDSLTDRLRDAIRETDTLFTRPAQEKKP